jgi:hypothetical protein
MTYNSRWDTLPKEIQDKILSYKKTELTDVQKREYGIGETDMAWFNNNNELYVKSEEDNIRKLIVDARNERKNKNMTQLSYHSEQNLITSLRNDYRTKYQQKLLSMYGVSGGNKKNKPVIYKKKIILGKERSIYKISGSRKDYIKYMGNFITVKDFLTSMRRVL